MADVYTPPPDYSYLLATPFDMPTPDGKTWAVAFSNKTGTILTAALSVVFTVCFMLFWNLVCFIAVYAVNQPTRGRTAAMVSLWNSNDSWTALWEMFSYAWHSKSFKKKSEFLYGLGLAAVAFAVFGASISLGIVGPSLIQIGNVAPARPSAVYYPATPSPTDYVKLLKEFGIRAPGVLRALGSVEAAKVTTRSSVNIVNNPNFGVWNGSSPIHQLTYTYSLTGVDFGLQHGSGLELTVEGSCTTEYDWVSSSTNPPGDLYTLWPGSSASRNVTVPINEYDILNAPKLTIRLHPDNKQQFDRDGNSSFAMVVWSARRASITQGSDPWYETEPRNESVKALYDAKFWMKRRRPALSCWQQDRWTYGSHKANSVHDLENIPGIKVPKTLINVLRAAFSTPVLSRLGIASGDSALRSRTTSPNGVIDAEASSIFSDLERLIVASFVATRNVFVDATMFEVSGSGDDNIVTASDGQSADGAGDFVITNPNIQTFSMVGLITLFCILVALLLIESIISLCIRHGPGETKSSDSESKLVRFRTILASQLWRRICELQGGSDTSKWPCDSAFPREENDGDGTKVSFGFQKGGSCQNNSHCNGHIECVPATAPVGERGRETDAGKTA